MNGQSFRFLKGGPTNWGYVLILIIVTILIAGGILGYSRYVINEIVSLSQFPEIERLKKIKEETANWKIYRNEGYGFKVKYPEDWLIDVKKYNTIKPLYILSFSNKQKFGAGRIEIDIQKTKAPSVLDWAKEAYGFRGLEEVKIEEGRIVGQQFTEKEKIFTAFLKTDLLYQIILYGEKEEPKKSEIENIYNQMLSTFRFLE